MCEQCHAESDDDYCGNSIAERRRKAVRSVLQRHSEFGLDPEDVTFRFTPKAEQQCVRVNPTAEPRYEIHAPESMGQAMAGGPPLRGIATAVWIHSDHSFETICDTLDVSSDLLYGAVFVSEHPPVDAIRESERPAARAYEESLREQNTDSN